MSKAQTDRGKVTERMAVAALRELGFPHAERAVRTGYRTDDREAVDPGDVTGTPGLVWQLKAWHDKRPGRSATAAAENAVSEWMAETERQRVEAQAALGILVLRRDYAPAERWWAFVPVVDLYGLADGFGGTSTPPTLRGVDRDTLVRWPARLELAHLTRLLRGYGFGEPLEAEALELRRQAAAHRGDGFHDAARILEQRARDLERRP